MKKAFNIDYSFVPNPDFSSYTQSQPQNTEQNDKDPDVKYGYHPFDFVEIQNYNPIYSLFFKMRDTNYNLLGLNHKYQIYNHVQGQSADIWNLRSNDGDSVVQRPVFFKYSPLVDHLTYMTTPIDLSGLSLPSFEDDNDPNNENRLLRYNNMAYTDGFFYYLSSQLLNTHGVVHGVDYYGSYVGIQRVFKFSLWDDMYESICDSKYFNDNLGKKFFLNLDDEFIDMQNTTWSRANRPALEFSDEQVDVADLAADIIPLSIPDSSTPECQGDKSSKTTGSLRLDLTLNVDLDSALVPDNREGMVLSEDEDDEDDPALEEDVGGLRENSSNETVGSLELEEDDDDESYASDFDAIEAYIPNYPVHMICMEKCEGLFEDLLIHRKLDDAQTIAALAQVVFALLIYQRAFQMTHNDLHTRNIMYVSTEEKYLYYRYNNQTYRVPTHGRIFKIIDFGRAIYKYRGKVLCSDAYAPDGEAEKLYNTEPYFNPNKKRVDPNPSFDLCRLATSAYDISESRRDMPMFRELMRRWCQDDRGKNVYMKNGLREERYPGFKLYMMIARTVHAHTPVSQLKQKEFKRFVYKGPLDAGRCLCIDIDAIPNYTV